MSPPAALEFVRRLALAALTGNGDMHPKNGSLIYREAGDKPQLASVYDVLSTIPYIQADAMALSLGGERPFKALNAQRWKAFANRARLPEAAVLRTVVDTIERVDDHWWSLPEREVVPAKVLERMDAHVRLMTPRRHVDRPEIEIMKLQDLEDTGAVFQIARQAIEGEAEKNCVCTSIGLGQCCLKARPRLE